VHNDMLSSVADELRKFLIEAQSPERRRAVERWLENRSRPSLQPQGIVITAADLMADVQVACLGSVLFVYFRWPWSQEREFVYFEELEDLSDLGPEGWARILFVHLEEMIDIGFYDYWRTIRIGPLEFFGPEISEER
jgi:hypothetical protein